MREGLQHEEHFIPIEAKLYYEDFKRKGLKERKAKRHERYNLRSLFGIYIFTG